MHNTDSLAVIWMYVYMIYLLTSKYFDIMLRSDVLSEFRHIHAEYRYGHCSHIYIYICVCVCIYLTFNYIIYVILVVVTTFKC